jgi:hypothetical protein
MLGSNRYFTYPLYLALIPISKDNRVMGILILDLGGEYFLLPVMWFVHPLSMIQLEPSDA